MSQETIIKLDWTIYNMLNEDSYTITAHASQNNCIINNNKCIHKPR